MGVGAEDSGDKRPGSFNGRCGVIFEGHWCLEALCISHTVPHPTSLCRAGSVDIGNLQSLEPYKDLSKCNRFPVGSSLV